MLVEHPGQQQSHDPASFKQLGVRQPSSLKNGKDLKKSLDLWKEKMEVAGGSAYYHRQWLTDFNNLEVVERNNAKLSETAIAISQKLRDIEHLAQIARKSYEAKQR